MNKIRDTVAHLTHLKVGNTKPPQKCVKRNRSRAWCFTINNPDLSDEKKYIDTLAHTFITCERYIFGIEKGESGTEHIQGYVYYRNPVSFSTIKELIPRAHIEKAKGTPTQNFKYCSKDGHFYSNMQDMKSIKDRMNAILDELKKEAETAPHENWMDNIIEI